LERKTPLWRSQLHRRESKIQQHARNGAESIPAGYLTQIGKTALHHGNPRAIAGQKLTSNPQCICVQINT
jgi:hypothetical protein